MTRLRILVIKLGALGDFIYALGPMRAIRQHHPQARITLLTRKPYRALAEKSGLFDDILIDPAPKLNPLAWLNARRFFRSLNIDRVYDLQNNDRTARYLALMPDDTEWVGAADKASHRNPDPERKINHAFQGLKNGLAVAGIKNIALDTLDWMEGDIARFALPRPFALIVPGGSAARPLKRWPFMYYRELAAALSTKGICPVLIGHQSEKELAAEIATDTDCIDLTGQTDLDDLPALARAACFAVGNDTGPLHIIAVAGCPGVMLFCTGESMIRKHGPQAPGMKALEAPDLSSISVQQVLQILET